MGKKLQMMAFIPKTTTIKIYTVAFPSKWKELLLKLAMAVKPNYDYEKYYLPLCSALGKICANWVHGLIDIKFMRKNTDDSEWIVCLNEIDRDMCREICVNLKVAAHSFYKKVKNEPSVKDAFNAFINVINEEELLSTVSSRFVEIINSDGRITDSCAYNGFCLKIMQSLVGHQIDYNGIKLTLYSSGRGELMSQILQDSKGQYFAYVFAFSLQTVPPESKSMLLLQCSRRRFKNTTKGSKNYLPNKLSVYIKNSGDNNYYKINMERLFNKDIGAFENVWNAADKECYNSIYLKKLPSADDLMNAIEKYNSPDSDPRLVCTISPSNSFASETRIGTGVSALDRKDFYNSIYSLISDSVSKMPEVDKGKARNACINPCKKYGDLALRLSKTGYKGLNIEIYSFSPDNNLAEIVENALTKDLADVVPVKDFPVTVAKCLLGNYALSMKKSEYKRYANREERILSISERIGKTSSGIMTGAIVVLPNDNDGELRDVKNLLRCGFALSGRVTQFINPVEGEKLSPQKREKSFSYKVKTAIADLFRQFGYSRSGDGISRFKAYPVIAIDVLSHIRTISEDIKDETARALPVMLKYNTEDGLIAVECPALNNGLPMPYYEACLQFVKLSMDRECAKKCEDAVKRYAEIKLKALENYYRHKDAIVIVSGDGYLRNELWPGISNKKISGYNQDEKNAGSIDIGNKYLSVPFNFHNSGLRIIRIRYNDEVPDYFISEEEKATGGAKGIFSFGKVYYGCVAEKRQDNRFRACDKEHSYDKPQQDYCRKRLIEYFPLVLQEHDDAYDLINYVNELRNLSPQYNAPTNVPLPLHYLGDRIKEYISFDE